MAGWTTHQGLISSLNKDNIDTDQLIPARFMATPRSAGYGEYLLYDLRDEVTLTPGASILCAGRNFGTGSSREAAVYALVDAGFRVVIAPSFGDIFAANAVNNGVLPACVADCTALTDGPALVDLSDLTITQGQTQIRFALDPVWQTKLIRGWDDIDLTQAYQDQITAYRDARQVEVGWAWPDHTGI